MRDRALLYYKKLVEEEKEVYKSKEEECNEKC